MSVLTGITGAVRSQIASRLNSAISGGIKSGVSSLTDGGQQENIFSNWKNPNTGKFTTKVMSYPDNVANDPQSGHFILFQIKSFTDGKLKQQKTQKAYNESINKIIAESQGGPPGRTLSRTEATAIVNNQTMAAGKLAAKTPAGIAKGRKSLMSQKPTVTLPAAISLYMPPSVVVDYKIGYADQTIGTIALMGSDIIKAFTSGKNTESALNAVVDSLGSTGAEGLKDVALKAIDLVAPGAKALVNLETGKVVTPKMEMMFENVKRRNFAFTFAFIPKSAKEAKTIKDIIYTFKENMMPEFVEGSSREMKIPNVFDITYMYHNQENKFINKISTCFLQGLDVTYGGDRFTAYDPIDGSPPPQKSSITLNFSEIETMNKDLIKQGY